MPRYEDLTGKTFGYLEVLEYVGTYGSNHLLIGDVNVIDVELEKLFISTNELKHNRVKSCGCLFKRY